VAGTYTVESADPAINTWTLDSNCTGNDPADEMTGRVDHGLAGLSNLSVGGVIRIEDEVSGEDTIAGVWDENGQRCWRLFVNESEQLVLELSTDGNSNTPHVMTSRSIDLNRNTFVYATWNGSTGDATLYVDGQLQTVDQGITGTLKSSTGPLTVGCSINNLGALTDGFAGVVGIITVDDGLLSSEEIERRAEEFSSRRGTYLNTEID
jgi:hypothetical protein